MHICKFFFSDGRLDSLYLSKEAEIFTGSFPQIDGFCKRVELALLLGSDNNGATLSSFFCWQCHFKSVENISGKKQPKNTFKRSKISFGSQLEF